MSYPPFRRRTLIVSLTALSFLGALDHTIVATTLPTIAGELDAVEHMSWIIVGYTLASTVTMPLFGSAADRFGAHRMLFIATGIFLLGSLLCGFATSITTMTAARVLQGIGSAGMHLMPQTLVGEVVPVRQRPAVMSAVGGAFPIAIVIGPLLGGLISDTVGWPWVFWINVPLGLLALAVARVGVPRGDAAQRASAAVAGARRGGLRGFDLAGTTATGLFTTCLVLAATWGAGDRGWRDPSTLAAIAVGLGALTVLVPVERRAASPVFPVAVLRLRTVALATVLSVVVGVGLFAIVQYVPSWVQMVYRVSATASGVVPMAMVLSMMVGTILSGTVVSRTGSYRWAALFGTFAGALGMLGLAVVPTGLGLVGPAVAMGVAGLGVGSFMMLVVSVAQAGAPRSALGTVTSVVNLSRSIASTFASAVVGAWLGMRVTAGLPTGVSAHDLRPETVRQAPVGSQEVIAGLYASAMLPVFLVLALVFVAGFVAALLLPADAMAERRPTPLPAQTPADSGTDVAPTTVSPRALRQ